MLSAELDAALYYSQNKNMIEYVFGNYQDPVDLQYYLGFRPINIENSRVYGFETELSINRPLGELNTSLQAAYTYMYPVAFNAYTGADTGDYLKYRRKHAASLTLSAMYRSFDLATALYYKSELLGIDDVFLSPATRETILPGFFDYWNENNRPYLLVDISFSYRFNHVYKLSAAIKNLGNVEYMGRPGDIQPQRYYSLMLSINI